MKQWKWVLITAVLAVGLVGCGSENNTSKSGDTGSNSAVTGGDKAITVVATNFALEPQEIRVKKGESVTITLDNKQGNHGISIPDLNVEIKKDKGTATFTADKAGEYEIVCSIMCGAGHNDMVSKLIVEE